MWQVLQCEDENACRHKTYSARGTNWDDITWPKLALSVWMLYLCMYNSLAATRKTFKRCNSHELSVINKRPETETLCTEKWESMLEWVKREKMNNRYENERKREREKKVRQHQRGANEKSRQSKGVLTSSGDCARASSVCRDPELLWFNL